MRVFPKALASGVAKRVLVVMLISACYVAVGWQVFPYLQRALMCPAGAVLTLTCPQRISQEASFDWLVVPAVLTFMVLLALTYLVMGLLHVTGYILQGDSS